MNNAQNIRQQFIQIADSISKPLKTALQRSETIELPSKKEQPFTHVLCRSVAGQQLSVTASQTIWQRVVDSAEDKQLMEHLLTADPQLLRECGLSAAKSRTVREIAVAYQAGDLQEKELANLTMEERSAELIKIWGIGQWTADMMHIFYFAEPDVWPDKDLAVRTTFNKLTAQDLPKAKQQKQQSQSDSAELAHAFKPLRSHLALYMWHIANAKLF